MKIPYITIHISKKKPKFVIGFAIYTISKHVRGCTLWCEKLKDFIRLYKYE